MSAITALSCATPILKLRDAVIVEPALIPSCILAALIGFICSSSLRKMKINGSGSYSVSFFLFGCMMTSAMIVHCFCQNNKKLEIIFGILDGGLTSCVALSWLFNGLVDVRLVNERKTTAKLIAFLSYVAILVAYTYTVLFVANPAKYLIILYAGIIMFCCPAYVVCELVYLCRARSRCGLGWLLLAGVAGAVGLASALSARFSFALCAHFGNNVNGDFMWFYLSDVAMFFLFMFFRRNRTACLVVKRRQEAKHKRQQEQQQQQQQQEHKQQYVPLALPPQLYAEPQLSYVAPVSAAVVSLAPV